MNKSNFIQGFFATVEVHTNKVSLDEFYTRFFYHIFYYIFTNFLQNHKIKVKVFNSTFAHKPKLFFSVNPEHVNNLF